MAKRRYPKFYEKIVPAALFFLVILALVVLFFAITLITGKF